jgi:hypothetical protein
MRPLLAFAVLLALAGAVPAANRAAENTSCAAPLAPAAYAASVRSALGARQDVWGNELLRRRGGPTFDAAARRLAPLLYAIGPRQRRLTSTGVYYIPFGWPSRFGATNVALHVADGSEILAQRTRAAKLSVGVGADGREAFGGCVTRLATPALAEGHLPILQTRYSDAAGITYEQESFASHLRQTGDALVSFVQLTADNTASEHAVALRFEPSRRGLVGNADGTLTRKGKVYLYSSAGGVFDGTGLTYIVPPGVKQTVYVAFPIVPRRSKPATIDERAYTRARTAVSRFWAKQLAAGAMFDVPEDRVRDALNSLLIQNLVLGWRYSIGDKYHTKLSTPEAIDAAEVMGEYGFASVARSILDVSFWRKLSWTANWRMGEQLAGTARYYSLFGDRAYVDARTPRLARYTTRLRNQLNGRKPRLLNRERYSADIDRNVFGLHSQSVAWAGLTAMGAVWARTGDAGLARRADATAERLRVGLARTTRKASRRLKDGSLFVPVRLRDGERPYSSLTASRYGSYWNLVMPYALASRLFPPHGREANGLFRYMLSHGSRFLGLTRAAAFTIYGAPRFPVSGTDQVYGLNLARFLADNDRPDQLVLSLYGQLAAGMTPGTYVSGEAATVAPFRGEYYRTMFLPPNSASNSVFLGLVRLLLIHETAKRLELAYATPRAWLEPGKRIEVKGAPTSFGPLSYTLEAEAGVVHATLDVPRSAQLVSLKLRLRLPTGRRLSAVTADGAAVPFDAATGTIDLGSRRGAFAVDARYG